MNKVRQFWEIISKPSYKYANQFLSFFSPPFFFAFFSSFFLRFDIPHKIFDFSNTTYFLSIRQFIWESYTFGFN